MWVVSDTLKAAWYAVSAAWRADAAALTDTYKVAETAAWYAYQTELKKQQQQKDNSTND